MDRTVFTAQPSHGSTPIVAVLGEIADKAERATRAAYVGGDALHAMQQLAVWAFFRGYDVGKDVCRSAAVTP